MSLAEATPALCVVCPAGAPREALDGAYACQRCLEATDARLGEISARYGRLDARPASVGLDGGRGAPGHRSRPPLSVHVAALRDHRSVPGPGSVYAAPAVLPMWVAALASERNLYDMHTVDPAHPGGSAQVGASAGLLRRHLDYIVTREWVEQFAEDVRHCCDQLRAATGDANPKPIGYCYAMLPRADDDPRRDMVRCAAPLFPPRGGTMIRCRACAAEYDGTELIRLALMERAQEGETA